MTTPLASSPCQTESWDVEQTEGSSAAEIELDVEALAERSRAGCQASFTALIVHFEKRIFHYLCHMTRNEHDAQDLTQITFLKAYQSMQAYRSKGSFGAWLFTIAKRTALNHFRDSRPAEELQPDLAGPTASPSDLLVQKDARRALWDVARSLSRNQYEALWLRYAEGFSIAETARIMNTSSLQVRVLLHRARAALGKRLQQKPAEFCGERLASNP